MDHDLGGISDLAIRLATEAGEILRKGRHSALADVTATKSSPVDIVTALDRESETHIVGAIRTFRPGDAILGEEGTSVEGTTGVRWLIDPLDGTVNFTYGIPYFAVSIGVEIDGVRTIGAVFNPATEELYTATRGDGARRNGTLIEPRPTPALSTALVGTGFAYVQDIRVAQAATFQKILPAVRDIRRLGACALDACSVAIGRLDAYYELNINPWDISAGDVIASETGARVTSFDGGVAETSAIIGRGEIYSRLLALIV